MGSLLTQVEVARAEPAANERAPIEVVLEYSAPPACPNEAQFRERAERSSARLRWGVPAEGSRVYRVLIDASPGGFQGQLYEASKATPRALEARACEELVDALSLMLALSADATLAGAAAPAAEHPLIKRSYTVKRDQSTFETPAFSEAFQLGVGARF
jgi:hypothetical protein